MTYSFQTFTLNQILTSPQMNQVEANIRDHRHGQSGVEGVFGGEITPTQLTANTNNYSPTNWATSNIARISSNKVIVITGLALGVQGAMKALVNVGSFTITFPAESTLSTAANRFANGFSLEPGKSVVWIYDDTSDRWRTESAGSDVTSGDLPFQIAKFGALDCAQALTRFMSALGRVGNVTESNSEQYVIRPFTMKELRAFSSTAIPASNSATFTVRKNGADTALTCTIAAAAQSASDIVNEVTFSMGDRYALKVVSSATAGTNDYNATVKENKIDQDIGFPMIPLAGLIPASGTLGDVGISIGVGGGIGQQIPMPPCLVSPWIAAFVTTNTQPGRLYKDNAEVPVLVADVLADVHRDSEENYVFEEMEALSVRTTGAYTASGMVFLKSRESTSYDPCLMAFCAIAFAQASTTYLGGYQNGVESGTELEVSIPMPACRIRNLRGIFDATPAAGQTMTVTVRKNGVATAVTCQFTNGGANEATDLVNEVTFAADDRLSIEAVSSATLGTRDLTISLQAYA